MTVRPIIALDAMGGDGGPAVTIAAAEIAHTRYPKLTFRFYGREDAIRAELARAPRVAKDAVVIHSDEEVLGTDKPSQVLRRARHSSMGMSVDDVIARSTWNPAREIHQEELGNLSVGSPADIAVLRVQKGNFGFLDMHGARLRGSQKFGCELTLRDGKVVYDLNGIARTDWDKLPKDYRSTGDPRWDSGGRRRPARPASPTQ